MPLGAVIPGGGEGGGDVPHSMGWVFDGRRGSGKRVGGSKNLSK